MEASQQIDLLDALLPLLGVIFIISVGVVLLNQQFQKSLYKQELEKENLRVQQQQALLRNSIAVQEQERQRIAQDLHDELGAALSLGTMYLKQLKRQAGKAEQTTQPPLLQGIDEVLGIVEGAMKTTRRISHELMPVQLANMPWWQAIEARVQQVNNAGALQATLTLPDAPPELSKAVTTGLYRMLAELLNNTMKHARATQVQIIVAIDAHTLNICYTDNGQGLPAEAIEQGVQGLGLQGLQGRASALNGTIELGNRAEGGFEANISLPIV